MKRILQKITSCVLFLILCITTLNVVGQDAFTVTWPLTTDGVATKSGDGVSAVTAENVVVGSKYAHHYFDAAGGLKIREGAGGEVSATDPVWRGYNSNVNSTVTGPGTVTDMYVDFSIIANSNIKITNINIPVTGVNASTGQLYCNVIYSTDNFSSSINYIKGSNSSPTSLMPSPAHANVDFTTPISLTTGKKLSIRVIVWRKNTGNISGGTKPEDYFVTLGKANGVVISGTTFTPEPVEPSTPFTPNNLAVVVAGDGTNPNSPSGSRRTNPLFLVEYSPEGNVVGVPLALPTAIHGENLRLVGSLDRSSNFGQLSLSQDASTLSLIGYNIAANQSSDRTATTERVIGLISSNKSINTSHFINDVNGNPRRALYHNKNVYTIGSAGGVQMYNTETKSTTAIFTAVSTPRAIGIYNNQLYGGTNSADRNVYTIGAGVPTEPITSDDVVALPGVPSTGDTYDFIFFDTDKNGYPDLLYAIDNTVEVDQKGIRKYFLNAGTWEAKGVNAVYTGLRDLTGRHNEGSGKTSLFCVSDGFLYFLEDEAAPNATISLKENRVLVAQENTAFKGVSLTPGSTLLPVKLTSFNGRLQGTEVALNWATASEKNNSHFNVLRSNDGKQFNKIGKVDGVGTSDIVNYYNYSDRFPFRGTNYYKLNQVDFDGKSEESKVIAVKVLAAEQDVKVYQQGNTTIAEVYSAIEGSKNISVSDIKGKTIYSKKVSFTTGINQFEIDLSSSASGVYILSIDKDKSVKFLK